MAKVIIPLLMIAGLILVIVLAVTHPACPSGNYCPAGGGGGSTQIDDQRYNPEIDQPEFHPDFTG